MNHSGLICGCWKTTGTGVRVEAEGVVSVMGAEERCWCIVAHMFLSLCAAEWSTLGELWRILGCFVSCCFTAIVSDNGTLNQRDKHIDVIEEVLELSLYKR